MIILIAPLFDLRSPVLLPEAPGHVLRDMTRRVNRRPTLSGRAVAPDYGYSVADRTFTVDLSPISIDDRDGVERLLQSYARLVVVTDEGCFMAAPSQISGTKLTLLVMEKLGA